MMNNGEVHLVSTIIRNVISLAAEADITALYINSKYIFVVQNVL